MKLVKALISMATIGLCPVAMAERAEELTPPADLAPTTTLDSGWQPLVDGYFGIPQGFVYTPNYSFGTTGIKVEQLKGELAVQRGESCGASLYSVDVQHDPSQTVLTRYRFDATGLVTLPATHQTIYSAVIILHQPDPRGGRCIIRLAGKRAGDAGGDEPAGFELAGALRYEGGFRQRIAAEITGGPRVSHIWLRLPEHCPGLEVLEAGTVTEGIFDAARLVDAEQQIYEVASGSERIGAVSVSFNGPSGTACEIPVFIKAVAG